MTFQPPPPPPGGPPAPPGGQPPGHWGPPPGGSPYVAPDEDPYGSPGGAFDPKTVDPLDWGILAAGFLALVFSFASYYTYRETIAGITGAAGHWNAWHGFFGWFAVLLALAGSAAVAISLFAPHVKLAMAARLAGLGAYALATLCVILAIFVVPARGGYRGPGLDKGHAIGFWINLIVIIAGLILSLMRFQQCGGRLPGPLANLPDIASRGAGAAPPPPPGWGYGPPAAGPGSGPPAR